MFTPLLLRTVALAAVVLACACSGPSAPSTQEIPPSQPVDRVKIVSAEPPDGSVLAPGSSVTFRYSFTDELVGGDTGFVRLIAYDQLFRTLNQPNDVPTVSVVRGTGEAQLSLSLTVPSSDVSSVRVAVALFIGAQTSSTRGDAVQYPVR